MLAVGTVVVGVNDMARAVSFWSSALDYEPRGGDVEDDWTVLVPRMGGPGTQVALMLSESPVEERPRLHLDLYAGDAVDQAAEVDRLVSLGAEQVDWEFYPEDPDFVVLADTEGNIFCVIDTAME